MTRQEFETRVAVKVSDKEFSAINEVYMNSEVDKDEFCKMWVKMNSKRVKDAKVERIAKAKDEAYRTALYNFYEKNSDINDIFTPICYIKMSLYEKRALNYAGINECSMRMLTDVRKDIRSYLGIN